VLPEVEKWDRCLVNTLKEWEDRFDPAAPKSAKKVTTDLLIAKNPKNAYPVYQLFTRAAHFTMAELVNALIGLKDADMSLKTSAQPAGVVLERAIMGICRQAADSP
jgi:DNA polymerase-3 subunit delta